MGYQELPSEITFNIIYYTEYGNLPEPAELSNQEGQLIFTEALLPSLTDDSNSYFFDGWYSTPTFDAGTKIEVGHVTSNTVIYLYAKWRAISNTVYGKMTAIADEIRELSGTDSVIDLDAMAAHINDANEKVDDQASIIAQIQAALEDAAAGVELPTLTNEGAAADLLSGKQLIDSSGNKVTGTFTIDNELNAQDNVINQIMTALEGKAAGGSGSNTEEQIVFAYLGNSTNTTYIIPFIEGMTWSDFISSEYNVRYFYAGSVQQTTLLIENPNGNPGLTSSQYLVPYDHVNIGKVLLTDKIVAGRVYMVYDDD